jgi:hypothetical protein
MYNHLGITHCNRGSHEKGMPFLQKASELYKYLSQEGKYEVPSIDSLSDFDRDLYKSIEASS